MISFLRSAYRNCYLITILFAVMQLLVTINGKGPEFLYLCIGTFVVALALHLWYCLEMQRQGRDDCGLPETDTAETLEVLEEALTRMGCQPKVHKNDGKIAVAYQGENLLFDVRGFFVRIVDYCWSGIDRNDPDPMAKFFAINHANHAFNIKLVYGWNEDGNIEISTYQEFCLYPGMRRLDAHLALVLQQLLSAHRILDEAFRSIMADRRSGNGDGRRPVGFTATEQSEEAPKAPEAAKTPEASEPTASARRPVGFAAAGGDEPEK